jgi:hypothetical protein
VNKRHHQSTFVVGNVEKLKEEQMGKEKDRQGNEKLAIIIDLKRVHP